MLGLLLAVEWVVASGADGLAPYGALGARSASRAARHEARSARVLALGDSVLKFGFDPAAFDEGFGAEGAYNLAVPGTPPMLGEALLRRALAAGARPEVIVIGYMTLSGDPRVHLNDFAEVFQPADALRLARDARDSGLFLGVMAPRVLPTLRYRAALRAGVLASLRGGPTEPGGPFAPGVPGPSAAKASLRAWRKDRGAELREADGRFDGRMEPDLERRLYSSQWRVHPVLARSFRRLCDLATASGASVHVVVTPIAPEAQARRDALDLDAPHTRNLRAVLARSPGVTVLDARRSGYPADAFFDSCHLNAWGAARLSADLARAVKTPSATSSAWVALPRVVPRIATRRTP
ncbi:MAG: hypothetical protein AB7I30_23625 [Isosphaeraceae bacterium]